MTITPEQREARRSVVGSSDISAIMGYSPFANAADVYWDKVGLDGHRPEKPWMQSGTWLEFPMLQEASKIFDAEIVKFDITVAHPTNKYFAANLDAITSDGIPVEAKTVRPNAPDRDKWGARGSDQIPDHVMLQVQHQMLCAGADKALVISLDCGFTLTPYTVRANKEIMEMIERRGTEFFENHVNKGIPPEVMPSSETLSLIPRDKDKIVRVDNALAADYIAKREAATSAKKKQDEAGDKIKLAMGDGEMSKTFEYSCTYRKNTKGRRSLNVTECKQ